MQLQKTVQNNLVQFHKDNNSNIHAYQHFLDIDIFEILRLNKNIQKFQNIWNNRTIETNKNCCKARIVPLIKFFPDIPNKSQLIPIKILSSLFKFLELRFLPKLQMNKQDSYHILSTLLNIINLLNKINGFKKEDKMEGVFIGLRRSFLIY
ncbi:unnamed protein product [Paramecium pentaurelia]|uniref:Uncharacterized protein n=1 Tax=Paramecium pentaurelia TaxID=43138 RepID=A0A8S1WH29_9CILI|nr:unnamed protein product [Paramecium pentaurelia]